MIKYLFPLFLLFSIITFSQEKQGENDIFYVDFAFGGSWGDAGGVNTMISLNYQHDKHLFTFRRLGSYILEDDFNLLFWFLPLTVLDAQKKASETSFLYGRRYIKEGFSYSFSGGISHIRFNFLSDNDQIVLRRKSMIGIPLEFNLKWFKSEKSINKLFGFIPIGKPSGFTISTGLKFYGTISNEPYIGAGLTFGFGYFKKYKN